MNSFAASPCRMVILFASSCFFPAVLCLTDQRISFIFKSLFASYQYLIPLLSFKADKIQL